MGVAQWHPVRTVERAHLAPVAPRLRGPDPSEAVLGASGAERSEGWPPKTKEVLVIDFLVFNYDFLGFPYYCIRIS